MKVLWLLVSLAFSFVLTAGEVTATSITAQQRYPWNGLVDIAVTIEGSVDDMAIYKCAFAAKNSATGEFVPVTSVIQRRSDRRSDVTWTRRFVWDAATDIGVTKIDDVALMVNMELAAVQLWENGPYWAECNVGASMPEECGYYFWWGDTVGYKRNASNDGWISVDGGKEFSFDSDNTPTYDMDKSQLLSAGYIDSTGNLVAACDAATAHFGDPWRMPMATEIEALISNCETMWTTCGGVYGCLITGRGAYASKSIFLPAAGWGSANHLYRIGEIGEYWSSTQDSVYSYVACHLDFSSGAGGHLGRYYDARWPGRPVRPLREFGLGITTSAKTFVTAHLKLDCRTGVRATSPDGEVLRYEASWCERGDGVRITDNGTVVAMGVAGICTWRPATDASATHLLKLEILSEGQVVGTETAQFALGYVRDVTARQLFPHNKVAIEFTVAPDIGEVVGANEELAIWCVRGSVVSVATRILGDWSAKPGVHRIVWDLEAEGLSFANAETTFGVGRVCEIPWGGVQLWEDGPYWAECNVGASKPEECGYYFWWGDAVGYKRNTGSNAWVSVKNGSVYSFRADNCPTYAKSNSQLESEGYIDSSGNLVSAHDAATSHLGAPWRMPTDSEFSALISNCDTTWTTYRGVYGCLVTGKGAYASRSVFLPAAGYGNISGHYQVGLYGYCWSSTPNSGNSHYAWGLYFYSSYFGRGYYLDRFVGRSVRPIRGIAK